MAKKSLDIKPYNRFNIRCAVIKALTDEWFQKYLIEGKITKELEEERENIFQLFLSDFNKRNI